MHLGAAQKLLFNRLRAENQLNNFTPAALSPFLTTVAFTSNASGLFAKPTSYCQPERIVSDELEYTPILQSEVRDAQKSSLRPIAKAPRYYEVGSNIQLLPAASVTGEITYLKSPSTPQIGYTLNSDNEPVYSAGTSVQLEFSDSYWMDIIHIALGYIGVSLSDADVAALAGVQTATQ